MSLAASPTQGPLPLLRVRDLCVHFPVRGGVLRRVRHFAKAVDGVSFDIVRGQSLGLVGESGCGKTTVGRAILRLIRATSGDVQLDGQRIFQLQPNALRQLRRQMQIIFQDPGGSLNPRMRVGQIVAEPLEVHGLAKGVTLRKQVETLIERCGLPREAATRYPHEFSGGQRQRIAIARALALQPKLIVCDEPTSALDVSVQAQILNLLKDLQEEFGLSYLFISHDIAVVHHMCDQVAVMYGGKIVEQGKCDVVIHSPHHEYTKKLLAAVPGVGATQKAESRKQG
jgi:ABC-type oligopeptide transport system ATPase subunit